MTVINLDGERAMMSAQTMRSARRVADASRRLDWYGNELLRQTQFDVMRQAFAEQGGLLCSEELERRLRPVVDQPISQIARWIVSRSIVAVQWQARTWIPAFQFLAPAFAVRPCCALALGELEAVFDDWEMACWFASPNAWLAGASPASCAGQEQLLLQAARADRFIARGA
ncbi:hypothetical protein CDL60_24055 [Roseateles noduli]|nr:hypothetical protein CDL60_24055 [Roseateles noduli]